MTSLALRAYLSGNITSSAAVCGEAHLDKRIPSYVNLIIHYIHQMHDAHAHSLLHPPALIVFSLSLGCRPRLLA